MSALPLTGSLCDGQLTVDGEALRCSAWWVLSLSPLWASGPIRGADRLLPGVTGVRAYRRRRTVATYSLPMLIVGSHDKLGVALADEWAGLRANVDALRLVTDPVNTGDGTRALVLTMPGGGTRTGTAHVSLTLGETIVGSGQAGLRATLDLSIPAGTLS